MFRRVGRGAGRGVSAAPAPAPPPRDAPTSARGWSRPPLPRPASRPPCRPRVLGPLWAVGGRSHPPRGGGLSAVPHAPPPIPLPRPLSRGRRVGGAGGVALPRTTPHAGAPPRPAAPLGLRRRPRVLANAGLSGSASALLAFGCGRLIGRSRSLVGVTGRGYRAIRWGAPCSGWVSFYEGLGRLGGWARDRKINWGFVVAGYPTARNGRGAGLLPLLRSHWSGSGANNDGPAAIAVPR